MWLCMLSRFSCVWLFATLRTVARQAPPSMRVSRQEYWSGCKTRRYKTPRGDHRQNTPRHKSQQDPLWPTSQTIGNKSKNKQMGLNETLKLLHSKGNYNQGEKTALRLGENNSKWSNRQRINLKTAYHFKHLLWLIIFNLSILNITNRKAKNIISICYTYWSGFWDILFKNSIPNLDQCILIYICMFYCLSHPPLK